MTNPNAFDVEQMAGETDAQTGARLAADSVTRGAVTGCKYAMPLFGDVDLTAYEQEIRKSVDREDRYAVRKMLVTQANTLDMIFNRIAVQAAAETDVLTQAEYLWMALQAQEQCCEALRTLGDVDNGGV